MASTNTSTLANAIVRDCQLLDGGIFILCTLVFINSARKECPTAIRPGMRGRACRTTGIVVSINPHGDGSWKPINFDKYIYVHLASIRMLSNNVRSTASAMARNGRHDSYTIVWPYFGNNYCRARLRRVIINSARCQREISSSLRVAVRNRNTIRASSRQPTNIESFLDGALSHGPRVAFLSCAH